MYTHVYYDLDKQIHKVCIWNPFVVEYASFASILVVDILVSAYVSKYFPRISLFVQERLFTGD